MIDSIMDAVLSNAASNQKPIEITRSVHPLDDPLEWMRAPLMDAPESQERIAKAQKQIDSIIGVTRNNESIAKLVWNGDRNYWFKFFMSWDALGRPNAPLTERPLVRFKALRDSNKKLVRDAFPPRWLLLTRIEPEQYAHAWERESFMAAPEIRGVKQIRPAEPPPVLWVWYATIAEHSGFCCASAEKDKKRCYGKYAPPEAAIPLANTIRAGIEAENLKSDPFSKIDGEMIRLMQNENTGYYNELKNLEVESEIYLENPMALVGLLPQDMHVDISEAKARETVKEFYKRRIDEAAAQIK